MKAGRIVFVLIGPVSDDPLSWLAGRLAEVLEVKKAVDGQPSRLDGGMLLAAPRANGNFAWLSLPDQPLPQPSLCCLV